MTRGALTTFSIANDVAKYFAIIPAAFATTYPVLDKLNIMRLATPAERDPVGGDFQCADHHRADSAGPARREVSAVGAAALLRDNLLIYGLGGLIVPFIGIKLIDLVARWIGPDLGRREVVLLNFVRRSSSLLLMSVLTGLAYPLLVTGVAQVVFPHQANGSLIEQDGEARRLGADRASRSTIRNIFGAGRRHASYNAGASSGSNLGPTNPALLDAVKGTRRRAQGGRSRQRCGRARRSGDGLGQRPRSAHLARRRRVSGQRVARPADSSPAEVRSLVAKHTEGRSSASSANRASTCCANLLG